MISVEKKKMGRPTDNPRPHKLSIRISDADKQILEDYCRTENVNRTEAVSRGIKRLSAENEEDKFPYRSGTRKQVEKE